MKVLIAPDSFKGSFTSKGVSEFMKKGILKVYPHAEIEIVPVADGGEGTVETLVGFLGGTFRRVSVSDPLGNPVNAKYGVIEESTAVIEIAESTGLNLVPEERRNPMILSSYGVGEQIKDALSKGYEKIIIGLGGSATNDAGVGMAMALGVRFLDQGGKELKVSAGTIQKIAKIDTSGIHPGIIKTEFIIATDVLNPLCGELGASRVFGPQKGATQEMVDVLDRNLDYLAGLIEKNLGVSIKDIPGSGAAGGIGGALIAFCSARVQQGIEFLMDCVNLDEKVQWADVVVTGEGKIDAQTIFGKVPVGVAKRAKKYNKPAFAICGTLGESGLLVYKHGIDAVMSSIVSPVTLEEAIHESPKRIEEASERLFRIIHAFGVK